jgi:hypothetical protein
MTRVLTRMKALVWGHSLIGAFLVISFFTVVSQDLAWSVPLVGCGAVWFWTLDLLERRASALTPADRTPAKGLPGWLLALFALGQIGGLASGDVPRSRWILCGHLLVGGTLLCRGFLCLWMDLPFHVRTWWSCLLLVLFGLAVRGLLFFADIVAGC